jgi:DNA-binding transcriptional MocR family regulator
VTASPGPKTTRVMDLVRAQICDGTLSPGSIAPSGTTLARLAGCNVHTARKALHALLDDGTLTPGPRPASRSRIAYDHIPDPNRILAALPAADQTAFRAAYQQAITQAHDPADWPFLRAALQAWNTRALLRTPASSRSTQAIPEP